MMIISRQLQWMLLIVFVLAAVQLVMIQKVHLLKVASIEKLSIYQEQREQLELSKIELSKRDNDNSILKFMNLNEFVIVEPTDLSKESTVDSEQEKDR